MSIQRYPLHWPEGWPREQKPISSRFQTSLSQAVSGLMKQIKLFGGKDIILSTNIPVKQDGLPYSRYGRIEDTGAAVYFVRKGVHQSIACDRWNRIEDNIHALELTVEAMRGMERWASSAILERMYRGFEALPERAGQSVGEQPWWTVLGVDRESSLKEVEKAYKKLSHKYHPDRGGSNEEMKNINLAMDAARKEKEG